MPYFTRQEGDKWCVVKGTKESPGETMHCYTGDDAHAQAVKYLQALYVNVEDATKTKEGVFVYKDADVDRWIAVSTIEKVDREGEIFTKEAMDWDIARAKKTGNYPELRLFHVKGFKLGQCDDMARVGIYAMDQGYWLDTPFAQAVKDVITMDESREKNGVSRGFYSVKATGRCPECGGDLMVGLANYIFGVKCIKCTKHHEPSRLKTMGLRHLRAVTFDISITDVPAVPGTAVAAYTLTSSEEQGVQHGN